MPNIPPIPPPQDFELGVFVRSFLSGLPAVQPPDTFEDAVHRAAHRSSFTLRNWTKVVVVVGLVGGLVFWVNSRNRSVVHTTPETVPTFNVTRPPLPLMKTQSNLDALDSPIVITPAFKAIVLPLPRQSIISASNRTGKRRVSNRPKGVAGY